MRTLAVFSLAAGIGLAAALASIVDAILLRPLPVARPWEIARVFTASSEQPLGFVSYLDFEDFRKARSIQGAVAECLIPVAVGDPPQIRLALAVTADYFKVLGVNAAFGRVFSEDEDRAQVAILARGSAADIGKAIRVAGKLYTIIGGTPANFGLDRFMHPDLYIPIRSYGDGRILEDRSRRFLTVHVRGVNAQPELSAIAARLESEYPATNRGRRVIVLDEMTARLRTDQMMGPLGKFLAALAALIFAIGCANTCGALLTRGEARTREIALKTALGASPFRLISESMCESASIAALGVALGLPLACGVTEALRKSIVLPTDFAMSIDARIDGRILALAFLAAMLATLVCGLVPAILILAGLDVANVLKARERGAKRRARIVLATMEIALAAAMIATGGSLWAGLIAAQKTNLGFRTEGISVATFDPSQSGYDESRTRAFYRDLMEHTKNLPCVRGVALAQSVPLGMTGAQKQITIGGDQMTVWMNIVTPDYFELMRIRIVAGRTFEENDHDGVIINEELAKRVTAGEKIKLGGRTLQVAGIAKNAKYMRWDEPPRPYFYLPYAHNYATRMTLHVESSAAVLNEIKSFSNGVPMSDARSLREYFDHGAMFGLRAALNIAALAGMGGLLLALAGLYGVVSSTTRTRRREIAIRIALGARHGLVLALVMKQAISIATAGAVAGLIAAFALTRLLRGLIPGAVSSIPASIAAVALVIALSMVAGAIPAVRAVSIDPSVSLRED